MSSLDFIISEWGHAEIVLNIRMHDQAPDDKSTHVFVAQVNGEEVYFEAASDLSIQEILQVAMDNIKEFLDYEKF